MPIVDIERGSKLDKIHARRMLHAFSQIVLKLVSLEDERVDAVLRSYSVFVLPGPVAATEYPPFAKQILSDELAEENVALALAAKKKGKEVKRKR